MDTNQIIPVEQPSFRPRCLLPTRVLSIFQEVKNSMVANIPTLAIYVDYQKAYDQVWHAALITKLWRLRFSSRYVENVSILAKRQKSLCCIWR